MNIGTAKPSEAELAEAPHYFINNLSVQDHYTAGMYERDALELLEKLFKVHDTIILVGGSTLYIKALLHGIDEIPTVTIEAKEKVREIFEHSGIMGIQEALAKLDPVYYSEADIENPRRMMRSLEVCFSTGNAYSEYLTKGAKTRSFDIVKLGIDVPREELYRRINERCDEMLQAGLLEEVKFLIQFRELTPLCTVGYSEFFEYMDGKMNLEEAISRFKQHTRNYAKRQLTWFRKEEDIKWGSAEELFEFVTSRTE